MLFKSAVAILAVAALAATCAATSPTEYYVLNGAAPTSTPIQSFNASSEAACIQQAACATGKCSVVMYDNRSRLCETFHMQVAYVNTNHLYWTHAPTGVSFIYSNGSPMSSSVVMSYWSLQGPVGSPGQCPDFSGSSNWYHRAIGLSASTGMSGIGKMVTVNVGLQAIIGSAPNEVAVLQIQETWQQGTTGVRTAPVQVQVPLGRCFTYTTGLFANEYGVYTSVLSMLLYRAE